MEREEARKRTVRINGIIVLLSLIWGTTYFVIKKGLADLPPFTAAGTRFVLAALVFAALVPLLSGREGGRRPGARLSVVMGLCNFAGPYGIVYFSETRLPSGLVSVLWGTFPLMIAVGTHLFLPSEKLFARQWLGFLVGFLGVVLLFLTDIRNVGEDGLLFGLLLLGSPALSTVGQIYVKKHAAQTSSMHLTRNGLWLAALMLAGLALLTEGDASVTWSRTAVFSVIYLALIGTVVTFGLYFWALRHASAHHLGMIAYLTPTIALLVGSAFGGEALHWHTLLGTALVLGSVGLVMVARE